MIETVDRKLARATAPRAETEALAYESAAVPVGAVHLVQGYTEAGGLGVVRLRDGEGEEIYDLTAQSGPRGSERRAL